MAIKDMDRLPGTHCNLMFEKSVQNWDEAIAIGNGRVGCLIWGDGEPLQFSLDRRDLWDNRPAPETLGELFTYKTLIEYVKDGDNDSIRKIFDTPYNRATPTKIPAGKIILQYRNVRNIRSELKLANALAEIEVQNDKHTSRIRTIMHAVDNIGLIELSNPELLEEVKVAAPDFASSLEFTGNELIETDISKGSLSKLNYPPAEYMEAENIKWFCQKTVEGLEYGVFLASTIINGEMTMAYCVASSKDGRNWKEDAKRNILEALDKGFDHVISEHEKWWRRFWGKSSISLPDKQLEKMWYLSNYYFGSCSRKGSSPMPLQGVWTADNGKLPPWKGDYHNDLNTQFSYLHYLKANHMEEGEVFIDFLIELVPQARAFAREFFDAPGLCLPSVMTIQGKALGGWPMYSLNLTNQIWLCQLLVKHGNHLGGNSFLGEFVYPYMDETAQCVQRWLESGEDGKLTLPLSSSPEIHDDELQAWLSPISNYDLALLQYLFKTLIHLADELGYGVEREEWKRLYNELPELAVDENGILMINPVEMLQESHRHHSHTMPIFPLDLLNYNDGGRDKEIIDATVSQLERLGTGLWVGFSFTWMSELYARQKNGEGAAYQLKLFNENLCSQNGFHLNGDYKRRGITNWHYRPFTLESNMCAADALQEMLLQTYDGVIRVFPAIPSSWWTEGCAFKDFRAMKGILVSSIVSDGEVISISLKSEFHGDYVLQNNFKTDLLKVRRADGHEVIQCEPYSQFILTMGNHDECVITKGQ